MYLLRKSDTGSFQELARASSGIKFRQLSLLTIAPGCTRGGHYHTRKKEWFCCLHGKCWIVATNILTGQQRNIVLKDDNREFAMVNYYEAHVALNSGDRECEVLIICDEEYDPDDADTIKYEGEEAKLCSVV